MSTLKIIADRMPEGWNANPARNSKELFLGKSFSSIPTDNGFRMNVFDVTQQERAEIMSALNARGWRIRSVELLEGRSDR